MGRGAELAKKIYSISKKSQTVPSGLGSVDSSPHIAKLAAPLDTEFRLLPYMDKVTLKLSQVLS